jgi:hypothetical protein
MRRLLDGAARGEQERTGGWKNDRMVRGYASKSCGCLVIDQDFQGMNIMGLGPLRRRGSTTTPDLHETGNERTSTILPILT